MNRNMTMPYVSFVVDDSGNGRELGDVELSNDEAVDLAAQFLAEQNWFSDESTEPDYIIH